VVFARLSTLSLLLLGLTSPATAQSIVPPVVAPLATTAEPAPEQMDVADLIRRWRGKPAVSPEQPAEGGVMAVISPIIGARPSTGGVIGVAGNVAFFTGDRDTTSISSAVGAVTVSTRSQTSITAHMTMFGRDDRWRFEVDDRVQWTSLETPGLGMPPPLSATELVEFDFVRLHHAAYLPLWRHLYAGGGFHFDRHAAIGPGDGEEARWPDSPYVAYTEANHLPIGMQTSAGPSVELIWDSRDNLINANEGWLARVNYRTLIDGLFGSDSDWDKVNVDVRAYARLTGDGRHKLAAWLYGDLVVDGVAPYFQLPSTGSDVYGRSGRGYAEGHFRGEHLAFMEVEYRGQLTDNGLLGMVAFANLTSVADRGEAQALFDRFAPGAGVGLRFKLNKYSDTNLAFDLGFGERGNRGIYLAVQEAF
jgi:hypothetical protein